ncbi:HipA domain-containing protein [Algoriphagus boritolerans]|nr:hypothetical protein [Algoriphagus boritolerans]
MSFLILTPLSFGQSEGLFEDEEILEIELKGDVKNLLKNTKGEPEYFDFLIAYSESADNKKVIPLRLRTRGHFRREMNICEYPPILLNFAKESTKGTLFSAQDKIKLVMPCRGEKYVIREYYAYRLYNLLTPNSFKVRLVRLTLVDQSDFDKSFGPFIGFLIEEEDQMAKRNLMESLDKDLVQPETVKEEDFLRMAVFQYLIGNTDWSVQYRQNIKLISSPNLGKPVAVPYDFDHAGIVRAPYAMPAPQLKLPSITDRRYRGFCIDDMDRFENTFKEFIGQKDAVYSLYADSDLLDEKYIKSSFKFLDAFYTTITSPKRAKIDFQYPCLPGGTGNVVIKGMN